MLVVSQPECPEEIAEQILIIAHNRLYIILVKIFFLWCRGFVILEMEILLGGCFTVKN
jgi:hypothetical protein